MNDELQRTEQWHADRCGKWTGSKFVDNAIHFIQEFNRFGANVV